MKTKKYLCILLAMAYVSFSVSAAHAPSLHQAISDPEFKPHIAAFSDNVMQLVDSPELFKLIGTIDVPENTSDNTVYAFLKKNVSAHLPWNLLWKKIKSLRRQKRILGKQLQNLLADTKRVDNVLEIGMPGTYTSTLNPVIKVVGKKYALLDSEGLQDYFHATSWNPLRMFKGYDVWIPLNNYAPLTGIKENSIDLIICVIGLHHIPDSTLDSFLASLKKILKPGGTLVLREHDTDSKKMHAIVSAAHSLYNLIADNVSEQEEQQEIRNFKPLKEWIAILEKHGFRANPKRILQEGDPTKNTFLSFTKMPQTKREHIESIHFDALQNTHYAKDEVNTFLTTPEWVNVDIAEEYAQFIKHTPFYEFPYLKNVYNYWNVFYQSWLTATKKEGFIAATFSSYTLMNAFIGITMTVEFAVKSIISLPIRLLFSGAEDSTIQLIISDPNNVVSSSHNLISVDKAQSSLKIISMPRYTLFRKAITELLQLPGVAIHEISGNKIIQGKVRFSNDITFTSGSGYKKEYEWTLPTQPSIQFASITIEVDKLGNVLSELEKKEIEILHLHDF